MKLKREYELNAPRGVAGRNSDNTFIQESPQVGARHPFGHGAPLNLQMDQGTYNKRKKGQRVVE